MNRISKIILLMTAAFAILGCSNEDKTVSGKFKSATGDVVSASKKAGSATSQAAQNSWEATKDATSDINE